MRLQEACEKFNSLAGIRFGKLVSSSDMDWIIINKGKTGQLLELALGMNLSSTNLDFEDGELKTNKCDSRGNPKETVFITQISSVIDELICYDGFVHTSNGKHIQVRSKDSMPYHPIYSNIYGREVSDKNHAFYFQKQFVYDIKRINSV